MNLTIEYLMQIIGEQTIEIRLLRQQLAELTKKDKPKKDGSHSTK